MSGPGERDPGPFFRYGRPRRVEGGLRARSPRGAIGESWWSRRFLAVLESPALGSRLARGRSYARAGQVLDLRVRPGVVTASVQGSREEPYTVTLALAPVPERAWRRVEAVLAGRAVHGARLLAGDVPTELVDVFAAAGAPLLPTDAAELDLRCDCPDAQVPCKHLAAACYLLAESFDADPFGLLHWRGRDRASLLARLRALRGAAPPGPGTAGTTPPPAPAGPPDGAEPAGPPGSGGPLDVLRIVADVPSPELTDLLDRFWTAPVPLPAPRPALAVEPDLLLRQLPPPPPEVGGADLARVLRAAYARFGR